MPHHEKQLPQWRRWCESGLDLLFPTSCAFCRGVVETSQQLFCERCVLAFEGTNTNDCQKCAGRTPPAIADDTSCIQCRGQGFRFDGTLAVGGYQDQLQRAVVLMKEPRHSRIAWGLGRLLAERVRSYGDIPSALVFTPVNWKKRWSRQACSAELLAISLGKELRIPVLRRGLISNRQTQKQSLLPTTSRKKNVRGAYRASNAVRLPHIGLVDDTMTTGATANELTKLLLTAGAGKVTVLLAARGLLNS